MSFTCCYCSTICNSAKQLEQHTCKTSNRTRKKGGQGGPAKKQRRAQYEAAEAAGASGGDSWNADRDSMWAQPEQASASAGDSWAADSEGWTQPDEAASSTTSDTWTCNICHCVLKVHGDGKAEQTHISGWRHQRLMRAMASTASTSTAAIDESAVAAAKEKEAEIREMLAKVEAAAQEKDAKIAELEAATKEKDARITAQISQSAFVAKEKEKEKIKREKADRALAEERKRAAQAAQTIAETQVNFEQERRVYLARLSEAAELKEIHEQNENFVKLLRGSMTQCAICLSEQASHTCVPCGHHCLCENCMHNALNARCLDRCPLCKQGVEKVIRVHGFSPDIPVVPEKLKRRFAEIALQKLKEASHSKAVWQELYNLKSLALPANTVRELGLVDAAKVTKSRFTNTSVGNMVRHLVDTWQDALKAEFC
eukprot:TRINITY_DN45058_c0_g1_i1.p1 TRINITY_DN45058_c0_g1~~TRINITY_DN45058_c0_g1_i1.p1  ORF type:complete len:428 (-),score=98.20 TRINITY_DN45058_c0_g1_i1:51-1334(-)